MQRLNAAPVTQHLRGKNDPIITTNGNPKIADQVRLIR